MLKQNIREKDRLKKAELHAMLVDKF
jgi:hypothetical protein